MNEVPLQRRLADASYASRPMSPFPEVIWQAAAEQSGTYRGTSLIRNRPPLRITIGA